MVTFKAMVAYIQTAVDKRRPFIISWQLLIFLTKMTVWQIKLYVVLTLSL